MSVRKRWIAVLLCGLLIGGVQIGCGTGTADRSGQEWPAEEDSQDIDIGDVNAADTGQYITGNA